MVVHIDRIKKAINIENPDDICLDAIKVTLEKGKTEASRYLSKKYDVSPHFYDLNLSTNNTINSNYENQSLVDILSEALCLNDKANAFAEITKFFSDLSGSIDKENYSVFLNNIAKTTGELSKNPMLHGFVFEDIQALFFNLKAKLAGKNFYAIVERPENGDFGKNSIDIKIINPNGVNQHYCLKCCKTSEATIQAIKDGGDYLGQRLLVPDDQVEEVRKAFPKRTVTSVLSYDGIKSKPYTYSECVNATEALRNGNYDFFKMDNYPLKDIVNAEFELIKDRFFCSLLNRFVPALIKSVQNKTFAPITEAAMSSARDSLEYGVFCGIKTYAAIKDIDFINKTSSNHLLLAINSGFEIIKQLNEVQKGNITLIEAEERCFKFMVKRSVELGCVAIGGSIGGCLGGPVGTGVGSAIGSGIGKTYSEAIVDCLNKKLTEDLKIKVVNEIESINKIVINSSNNVKKYYNETSNYIRNLANV